MAILMPSKTLTCLRLMRISRPCSIRCSPSLPNWNGRQASLGLWQQKIAPLLESKLAEQGLPVARFRTLTNKIVAEVSLAEQTMRVPVDRHGVAIWRPIEREVLPADCARCSL